MGFSYNVNVLKQKGSPAIYTDTFANRPPFGFAGRLFIANDTAAIYEDTGTSWILIANVSSGAGTLQQVTTNGNTSNVGISVTAGGVSTNSATITSLTTGSVPFVGAAGLITQDNANLFFDDTNNRLGINTNTPSNNLDVHGTGTTALLALNNTSSNQSLISFLKNSNAKWRIGNSSTDTFDILNVGLTTNAITISSASNSVSFLASIKIQQSAGFAGVAGFNGIGCDAGGFFFQIGTNTSNPYFNFIGLTGARTYTYPDATGTLALTADLSAYLLKTGGTLTGNLTISVATGLSALTLNNASLSGKNWSLINTTNGANSDLSFFCSGTSGGTHVTFANNGNVLINSAVDDTVNKLQVNGTTATTGIKFPATQVPSADVNVLDDYEEGTFTPILRFGGASVGITYFDNIGNYTKIGRQVSITLYLALTAIGSSTGSASISGLPFTNGTANRGSQCAGSIRFNNITYNGMVCVTIGQSSSIIDFTQVSNIGIDSVLTNTNFNAATEMSLSFTYFT